MKGTIAAHDQLSMQAAFVPPRTALSQRVLSVSSFFQDQPRVDLMESAYQDEAAVRDNSALRQQLTAKNVSTVALQKQVDKILQLGDSATRRDALRAIAALQVWSLSHAQYSSFV